MVQQIIKTFRAFSTLKLKDMAKLKFIFLINTVRGRNCDCAIKTDTGKTVTMRNYSHRPRCPSQRFLDRHSLLFDLCRTLVAAGNKPKATVKVYLRTHLSLCWIISLVYANRLTFSIDYQ